MGKLEIVKVGSTEIRLHECGDGLWRWHYYDGGRRKSASAKLLADAKDRAKGHLESNLKGRKHHRDLSDSEASLFNEWMKARKKSPTLKAAADEYLQTRTQAGLSEHHLRTLRQDLDNLAESFPVSVSSITAGDLEGYLNGLKCGARRRNNVRQVMISLFRWCRERGKIPDERTAADLTTKSKELKRPVTVFTAGEIDEIFRACGEEWRPALAIQAFAGIRTEEVSRLVWGDIKIEKRLIDVPADSAKTGRRRLVPIHDNLVTFLDRPGAAKEPIAPVEGMEPLVKRLVRKGIKWKKNALRHSYGSYRCAKIADVPRVAFEMGNSPAMVLKNYNEAQELADAIAWFNVTNTYPRKIIKITKAKAA